MGGRLDAVNIIDADVSVITNVGLDHEAWLGQGRESIGREKAGIMRPGRPAICGDPDPPGSLLAEAAARGAEFLRAGIDFGAAGEGRSWTFRGCNSRLEGLPVPALAGGAQRGNAALALAALEALGERLPVAVGHVRRGLGSARLPGRIEARGQAPQWVFDVCHNPDAAAVLADWLASNPVSGETRLVFAMLADKAVDDVARILDPHVQDWYLAGLSGPRGLSAEALEQRVGKSLDSTYRVFSSVALACEQARRDASPGDRIVVCGSFHTVGEAMALGL